MDILKEFNTKEMELVAIDHGNKDIKTDYGLKYQSGFIESVVEPISSTNLLVYNNKFYSIGAERFPVMDDKTANDKFFILTLPSIADYLAKRGLQKAEVCLAVGLPILTFGRLKAKFREYFLRKDIEFEYYGGEFQVSINDAYVFPQGLAGIMKNYNDYKEMTCTVVDLGGGTMDYFSFEKGNLNMRKIGSQNLGVIQLFNIIRQEILKTGVLVAENQIEEIILEKHNPFFTDENIVKIVIQKTEEYVDQILNQLKEENYEIKANPLIMMHLLI